jgi:YHS domain-containing protein
MTAERQVIDPVCGMTIDNEKALSAEYEGTTFYLCSTRCRAAFEKDAAAYVAVSKLKPQGWGKTPRPGFLPPE